MKTVSYRGAIYRIASKPHIEKDEGSEDSTHTWCGLSLSKLKPEDVEVPERVYGKIFEGSPEEKTSLCDVCTKLYKANTQQLQDEYRVYRALKKWVGGDVGNSNDARTELYNLFNKTYPGKFSYTGDLYRIHKIDYYDWEDFVKEGEDWQRFNLLALNQAGIGKILSFSKDMKATENFIKRYLLENYVIFKIRGKGVDIEAATKKLLSKGDVHPGYFSGSTNEKEVLSPAPDLAKKILRISLRGMEFPTFSKALKFVKIEVS